MLPVPWPPSFTAFCQRPPSSARVASLKVLPRSENTGAAGVGVGVGVLCVSCALRAIFFLPYGFFRWRLELFGGVDFSDAQQKLIVGVVNDCSSWLESDDTGRDGGEWG